MQVGSDVNWSAFGLGNTWTLALKTDGTLWAWGFGGYGSLGQNYTNNSNVPVQIGDEYTWTQIWVGPGSWIATSL